MTLRTRAGLWTAAAVALGILLVVAVTRQAAESSLIAAVDADLEALVAVAPRALTQGHRMHPEMGLTWLRGMGQGAGRAGFAAVGGPEGLFTVLDDEAQPVLVVGPAPPPLSDDAAAVARGELASAAETLPFDDGRLRVLTEALPRGGAVQLARPLDEVDDALARLTRRLVGVGALGVLVAALLAMVVAERISRPVRQLTETAERVSRTQELDARIAPVGEDEMARLGRAFDRMLASLEQARQAQAQLVADASHELRTPLTSLRTNIDLLRSGAELPADDHSRLLADVGEQLEEFGRLVDGLVELARGDRPMTSPSPVALDDLTAEVVAAVARDHPDARLTTDLVPTTVTGEPDRLARALRNVLVNAVLHGGGEVQVTVDHGRVTVRDHGPGIAAAHLPHVLDRFYRAPEARSRPGSGLGLAIVDQVARSHGGEVSVGPADGGGTVVTLALPEAPEATGQRPVPAR